MSAQVLALVVRDESGDLNVCDSRTGESLAVRYDLGSANEVASFLNSTYPVAEQAPAFDTLVHEIIGHRISGKRPEPLVRLVQGGEFITACPDFVPFGPGWDHLYPEHESPGPRWYRRSA